MPVNPSIPDTVIQVLNQTKDKHPTEAVIYGIDGDRADIQLDDSVAIVRHVQVIGNIDIMNVGDVVQISWRSDGRPVIMLTGSGGMTSVSQKAVVPDNATIENSNVGLRVKQGGISREHLAFVIPDELELLDSLLGAGWTVNQNTGVLSHTGISISPINGLSLGSGNDIVRLSSYGSPDDPASPEDDTEYRFWVGHTYPYAAPFTITKTGYVRASKGSLGGWELTDNDLFSDAGNAVIHSGARPFIGLGTTEYLGDGFWAGLDTDYVYKVSIGSASAGRLAYDGTSLALDNLAFNMYYGTLWTLEIQADGDFTIGSEIDTVAGTSMKIFTNAQTWDSEAFGAGDVMIGDHGGAHMAWDQAAGQLQFRDGSVTGIPVRAYIDTDGSMMFGTGQGRLDDSGFTLEGSTSRTEEYYWNSVNWVDSLGVGEYVGARLSGAIQGTGSNQYGEVWLHAYAETPSSATGRVSLGADANTSTGEVAWFMVDGSSGGEMLHWTHNDDLDGVNVSGDLQHWVLADPFTSPPQAGFGHRTAWYLQDDVSSIDIAAFMDVVWIEGWGGGEPSSAMKFFVYPDGGMTEMFRIGAMESTGEDPYAVVVNPQEHSEGNFLVMGASAKRLIETDSEDGIVMLGGVRTRITYGSTVTIPTGADYGLLYAWSSNDKLYWQGADNVTHDLTAGGEWTESSGFLGQTTVTDIVQLQNWLELEELSSLPGTGEPGTGWGAIYVKASDSKLYFKNDGGTEYELTVQSTIEWTESSGFLTQATATDIVQLQNWLELEELGTGSLPTTGEPGTGWGALYVKSDGKAYFKNDSGTEYDLTTGVGVWSASTGFIYPTTTTDDVIIGGASLGTADHIFYDGGDVDLNYQSGNNTVTISATWAATVATPLRLYNPSSTQYVGSKILWTVDDIVSGTTDLGNVSFYLDDNTAGSEDSHFYIQSLHGGSLFTVFGITPEGWAQFKAWPGPGTGDLVSAGFGLLYIDSADKKLYYMDDDEVAYDLTEAGGAGGADILEVQVFM